MKPYASNKDEDVKSYPYSICPNHRQTLQPNIKMGYKYYNPNPKNKKTSDCVIRAICRISGMDWESAYLALSTVVLSEYEMPSSNYIWETYLKSLGYRKTLLPNTCPECYRVRDFAADNPRGFFVACTGSHVVAVVDGTYYDAWDSGDEVVSYFFSQ